MSKILDELRPLPPESYEGGNLNWLIMFAVGELEARKVDLSFENVVVAAFRLFPKKFSLLGHPSYPDAKRVHDALVLRCAYKDRQWLEGKTRQGFLLTDRGLRAVEKARELVGGGGPQRKKALSQTRRWEKIFGELRSSPAYRKYEQGQSDIVSEAECCHVLQGTLDSNRQVLIDNLSKLQNITKELEERDVASFLDWLKKQFGRFLGEPL